MAPLPAWVGWLGFMNRGVVTLGWWARYRPVGLSVRSLSAVRVGVLAPALSPSGGGVGDSTLRVGYCVGARYCGCMAGGGLARRAVVWG